MQLTKADLHEQKKFLERLKIKFPISYEQDLLWTWNEAIARKTRALNLSKESIAHFAPPKTY